MSSQSVPSRESLSICTPAILRPELLELTYSSLSRYLKGVRVRGIELFINIDPAPRGEATASDVEEVARRYFDRVHVRAPEKASFPGAINWLWSSAKTDYILHMEDDWEMTCPFDIATAFDLFDREPSVLQIRLHARAGKRTSSKKRTVLGTACSFMRASMYSKLGGKFSLSVNPECQLRQLQKSILGVTPGQVISAVIPKRPVLVDRGRDWLKVRGMRRPRKADFIKW